MKTRHKAQPRTSRRNGPSRSGGGELNNLRQLLVEELRDLYDAENQLVKALPKVAAAASSAELRDAIEAHLKETRGHAQRLDQVFQELGEKARSTHCDAMAGLLKEGQKMLAKRGQEAIVDAGIVAAAQRVEHYEIAGYGCVIAFARRLGLDRPAQLLEETLTEEKKADQKLTEITESALELEAGSSADEFAGRQVRQSKNNR